MEVYLPVIHFGDGSYIYDEDYKEYYYEDYYYDEPKMDVELTNRDICERASKLLEAVEVNKTDYSDDETYWEINIQYDRCADTDTLYLIDVTEFPNKEDAIKEAIKEASQDIEVEWELFDSYDLQ